MALYEDVLMFTEAWGNTTNSVFGSHNARYEMTCPL